LLESVLKNSAFTDLNGWHFTYAPFDSLKSQAILADLHIGHYDPWVASQPTFDTPDKGSAGGILNGEVGGADILLNYAPLVGSPTNIRFLQIFDAIAWGQPRTEVDNPFDGTIPFYFGPDYPSGLTYFSDIPGVNETRLAGGPEYENNPVAIFKFQTFIAEDLGADAKYQHNVTVWGGLSWGYQFDAYERPIPESSSFAIIASVSLLIFCIVRENRRAR
jgi:hypothetical protein